MIKRGHSFKAFCKRSGSILWTVKDGTVWYCLSRHTETGELGDWGGGSKATEDARAAMVREGIEESRGVFRGILTDPATIDRSIVLVDGCNMAIYFIYVPPEFVVESVRSFEEAKRQMATAVSVPVLEASTDYPTKGKKKALSCLEEVSELVWVDHFTFSTLVTAEPDRLTIEVLWVKIRGFLRKLASLDDFRDLLVRSLGFEFHDRSFRPYTVEKCIELSPRAPDTKSEMEISCPCEV